MLFIILTWLFLSAVSLCLGSFVLALLRTTSLGRSGDRFIVSLWTGLLFWSVLLLAVSIFHPLTFLSGFTVLVFVSSATLVFPATRSELLRYRVFLSTPCLINAAVLTTAAALVSVQVVSNRDAISYHYDIILYLSHLGVPPGLSLVHERLGYVSSWFAIPAVFNHGFLAGRTSTLGNGFALLLAAGHLQLSLYRILKGKGRVTDFFTGCAIPMTIVFPLLLNYTVNPTPDFAIVMLTPVIAWLMLLLDTEERPAGADHPLPVFNEHLLPLALSAAALTIKVVSVPLLIVASLYYWNKARYRLTAAVLGSVLVFIIALPFLAASIILTGCPLFPLPLCLDLPWTIGRGRISVGSFLSVTRQTYFFRPSDSLKTGIMYLALAILGLLTALRWRPHTLKRAWHILLLGMAGIGFLLVFLPTPRFGWGYMALLIAAPVMVFHERISGLLDSLIIRIRGGSSSFILSFSVVALVVLVPSMLFHTRSEKLLGRAMKTGIVEKEGKSLLLVPPVIPKIDYDDDNDRVVPVAGDTTGHSAYGAPRGPFYPLEPGRGIRFRSPKDGPSAGFEHDM